MPHTGKTKKTGELDLAELSHKVEQLTSLLSKVPPVVQKLKAAYEAAQEEEDDLLNSSEGEGEENAADDKPTEALAKKGKSNDLKASSWAQLAQLVKEVPPLHEKVSSLVHSLLASGLNESALLKRKENIRRSTRRSGILLKKQPETWMPGYKKCKNHSSGASFPLPGL